jgi:hypothetical protein
MTAVCQSEVIVVSVVSCSHGTKSVSLRLLRFLWFPKALREKSVRKKITDSFRGALAANHENHNNLSATSPRAASYQQGAADDRG